MLHDHLTTDQLANEYPALFTVSALRKSRMRHPQQDGPPFLKLGRKVAYSRAAVSAWVQAREVRCPDLFGEALSPPPVIRRGRPTKAEEIARRNRRVVDINIR